MRKQLLHFGIAILSCGMLFGTIACNNSSNSQEPTSKEVVKEGKRVYFAAPLFSQAERDYNLVVTAVLEKYDYEVFLPQRDGFLAPDLAGLTEQEKVDKIFAKDYEEIMKADIFFAVLDGRVPDDGVCVEIGIAYANNKRIYGFKTDARTLEADMNLNPMITGALDEFFLNLDGEAALKELTDYLDHNQL